MLLRRSRACSLALALVAFACGASKSRPAEPQTIEVGEGEPEPPPPASVAGAGLTTQLLSDVRDALLDETYGARGEPDRFINSYLWALYVPRTRAVPELHRYNVRFLQENPSWEYDDPREGLADRLFALSRKPEILESMFAANKQWLYSNLSVTQYRELQLDTFVAGLLKVHAHVFSRPDAKNRLKSMSIGLSLEPPGDAGVPYPSRTLQYSPAYFKDFWSPESAAFVEAELCRGEPGCEAKAQTVALWMHGFWLRRNTESNQGAVKKILEEVAKHYSG